MTDKDLKLIPASAWENVGDPAYEQFPCNLCGNKNTTILTIVEMMANRNQCAVIDENTFMIPNNCWGYISCASCEQQKLEAAQRP